MAKMPVPEMPPISLSAHHADLMKAYSNDASEQPEADYSIDEIYKKTSAYKNAELSAKFNMVKSMTLMDDDDVLETIHSYGAGFDKHRENWIFTFLTNEYKSKYPDLTSNASIWEWVCFVILMLVMDGEQALTKLKNSSYTGINVDNANAGRRKRLRIGTKTTTLVERYDNRLSHPFENHEYYKNHVMVFNIGRAIEYVVPSIFAPLKATHTRATQNLKTGSSEERVPCIRMDFTPGYVVNFTNTVVNNYTFLNYDCPELVEYIESLVDNTLKLKYGLKVGTRKAAGNEKILVGNDDAKKTGVLSYSIIKSISAFVETKKDESCLGIRSYDDLKVTVGNNVLLNNDEFDAIVARFDIKETERYSNELDKYIAEKQRRIEETRPLRKSKDSATTDQEDTKLTSNEDAGPEEKIPRVD